MFGKFCAIIFFQIIFSLYLEVDSSPNIVSIDSSVEFSEREPQTCSRHTTKVFNLYSNQTIPKYTSKNMTYNINIYTNSILENDGRDVIFYPEQKGTAFSVLYGFAGEDIYLLDKFTLHWTKDGKGRSASAIDGKGAGLDIEMTYINSKCAPIEKAESSVDCILKVFFGILVKDGKRNYGFDSLKDNCLEHVKTPNTNTTCNYLENIVWCLPSKAADMYYIFSTSCEKIMYLPTDEKRFITPEQFLEIFPKIQTTSTEISLEYNKSLYAEYYQGIIASLNNFDFKPMQKEL